MRTLGKADSAGLLDTDLLKEEQVLLDLLKTLLPVKFVLIKDADLDFQKSVMRIWLTCITSCRASLRLEIREDPLADVLRT